MIEPWDSPGFRLTPNTGVRASVALSSVKIPSAVLGADAGKLGEDDVCEVTAFSETSVNERPAALFQTEARKYRKRRPSGKLTPRFAFPTIPLSQAARPPTTMLISVQG
jgi:hypothetical protein